MAQIVPDLRLRHSPLRSLATANLDPQEARFRLFDAVTNFLKMGGCSLPMLIVFDDLHDADEASLALLRFMARELKGTAILIVATYRDVEVRRSPRLSKLIGDLGREARSIPIVGLRESQVTKLVEFSAGKTPDQRLVAKLCAATGGNPLFVDGIVRGLMAEGSIGSAGASHRPFKIPGSLRAAIRGRLDPLSSESNAILGVAAAIGNEFGFDLCLSVAEVSADEARRLLEEASIAGIVTALGLNRYRFFHALVRGAVYDELDSTRRIRIHGKIANRLEEIYREDIDPRLAELAHHFREAGGTEKAIDYSIRAGQAAVSVFAYSDAVMLWQEALSMMERHGSEPLQRADLLYQLGRIAFEVDRRLSLEYGQSAIELYESKSRYDLAAHVNILLGQIFHMRGEPLFNAALANDHLRRAESVMRKEPESIFLADLYHIIAANECHKLNVVETASYARRAMEICDRIGSKTHWPGPAAFYAWSLVLSGNLREGFALYERTLEIAIQAKVPCFAAAWGAGLFSRWLGDPLDARRWYEREQSRLRKDAAPLFYDLLSTFIGVAYFGEGQLGEVLRRAGSEDWGIRFWVGGEWEAVAALIENHIELCEKTADSTSVLDLSVSGGLAYGFFLGEYARAEVLFKYGLDNGDRGPAVIQEMRARPWLARLYVLMNRLDEASEQVARCRQIMAAGEDWRGLVGDVARAEAAVEAAHGNYENSYPLLTTALAIHRKYHAAWDEADTLELWGRVLAAAGDRIKATEKFDAAIESHRSRGVGPRFLEYLNAEKMRALGPRPTQNDIGGAKQSQQAESKVTGAFRREGEFWTITYRGTTFRLKDAKGLRYIGYLLARPGQRIHVYDLIEAVDGRAANGRTTIHAESEEDLEIVREIGGPAPTLDARARSEYRARLRDLQAELDDAERTNDLGRSERLSTEIGMVGQELTGSLGLGGRSRAVSGSTERARGPVRKNIRSVVEKIRHEHPALGRHFAAAISTGYFCAYQPEPDHPISWQL